jgi:hypothetical protein
MCPRQFLAYLPKAGLARVWHNYLVLCSTHFQLACFADSQLAWADEQAASAENTTRIQSLQSTQEQLRVIDEELRKLPATQMQSAVGRRLRGQKMRMTNSQNILQREVEALESRILLFRQVFLQSQWHASSSNFTCFHFDVAVVSSWLQYSQRQNTDAI